MKKLLNWIVTRGGALIDSIRKTASKIANWVKVKFTVVGAGSSSFVAGHPLLLRFTTFVRGNALFAVGWAAAEILFGGMWKSYRQGTLKADTKRFFTDWRNHPRRLLDIAWRLVFGAAGVLLFLGLVSLLPMWFFFLPLIGLGFGAVTFLLSFFVKNKEDRFNMRVIGFLPAIGLTALVWMVVGYVPGLIANYRPNWLNRVTAPLWPREYWEAANAYEARKRAANPAEEEMEELFNNVDNFHDLLTEVSTKFFGVPEDARDLTADYPSYDDVTETYSSQTVGDVTAEKVSVNDEERIEEIDFELNGAEIAKAPVQYGNKLATQLLSIEMDAESVKTARKLLPRKLREAGCTSSQVTHVLRGFDQVYKAESAKA